MKKAFLIAGIAIGLLVLAAVLIPLLFKDKILALVKSQANQQLNAKLEFADLGLSLFSDFPNVSLSLDRLAIINHAPFAGDTLVALEKFQTSLDLFSLFGGAIKIRAIELDQPRLRLIALEDGATNWNITKETAPPAPEEAATSGFNLALQKYAINNGKLLYYDQAADLSAFVEGLNHSGSGDFTQDRFSLRTQTDIASLTLASGGTKYLNGVHTVLKADIDIDNAASKYTLSDNELRLNELILRFTGAIALAGEKMDLDLKFEAPQNEFKNVISLIPTIYAKDFAQLKTSGQFALRGEAKGVYGENQYPAFNLQLQVNNGMLQYPQLPTAVNNVNMNLLANNPGGDLDNTVIDLKQFHVELGREPFDASLLVRTPISDPDLNANVRGKINLGEIKNFMPLAPGTELAGVIDANLNLAGRIFSAQQGRYEQVHAAGNLAFRDILYQSKELPEKVAVSQALLAFTPANVKLDNLSMKLGQSDVQASGTLDNVLPYVMKDETLKGTLSLQSRFFDLDPWMAGESAGLSAVALPDKVDFTLQSVFQEMKYGKIKIQNLRGTMLLRERTLHMQNVSMNMLNGAVVMNGRYSTPPDKPVNLFFDLNVHNLGIPQAFESFVTVQKFAPIAQSLQGSFSSNFQINTDVDSSLMPVFSTLNSRGALNIANATLANFMPLTRLAEALKMDKYKTLSLTDLHPSFRIRDGRFFLDPVGFKVANTEFVVSGSNGIDQSLDYALKLRVPAREMNQQANAFVNDLLKTKVDPLQNEYVDLVGVMKGSLTDPQVKFSGGDIVKGVAAQATNILQQQMDQHKKAAADSANALLAKQKEEAEKLRRAAVDSVKSETERLKEEAKKKLKKLFKP